MLRLDFLFVGKTRASYIDQGVGDFVKRLGHYARLDLRVVKEQPVKQGIPPARIQQLEGEHLLAAVHNPSFVVALDPGGRQCSSLELAELVTDWERASHGRVSFLIGGPLGLSSQVLDRAGLVLSLSRLTFTHEMARLLLVEQIYRAYTIKAGTKYHK